MQFFRNWLVAIIKMDHQIRRIIAQSEKGRTEYLFTPERGEYKTGENKSGTRNGMRECHSWEKSLRAGGPLQTKWKTRRRIKYDGF